MGKMNVVINDEIEERFRKAVAEYKGMRKGNISRALEEAIDMWINSMGKPSWPQKKARINA